MKKEDVPQSGIASHEGKFAELFVGDRWELPTDFAVVNGAEEALRQRLTDAGWGEGEVFQAGCGFREALINAIGHGNLGISEAEEVRVLASGEEAYEPPDTKVTVELTVSEEKVSITVRDEGEGFDWRSIPDPTSPERLLEGSGRGLFFMHTYFDSVEYNRKGNEVTLVKRIAKENSGEWPVGLWGCAALRRPLFNYGGSAVA